MLLTVARVLGGRQLASLFSDEEGRLGILERRLRVRFRIAGAAQCAVLFAVQELVRDHDIAYIRSRACHMVHRGGKLIHADLLLRADVSMVALRSLVDFATAR